jgi:alpha-galactosidase
VFINAMSGDYICNEKKINYFLTEFRSAWQKLDRWQRCQRYGRLMEMATTMPERGRQGKGIKMSITFNESEKIFSLSGGDVSYVLHIAPDGRLMNLYWGKRIPDGAIHPTLEDYPGFASFDLPINWQPAELPTLGTGWYGTPAIDVENAEGDDVVDLRYASHIIYPGKRPNEGLPATYVERDSEAQSLEIDLKDALTGLTVTLRYSIYESDGAVTRSMRIQNDGARPLVIKGAMSASAHLWGKAYDVIHLKGAWARERSVVRTAVGDAEYRIFSQRGASGHEENPFIALCERHATEHWGNVWAVNFIYSGSFLGVAYVDNADNTRLSIGMNPNVFNWRLLPGEHFQAPEAVMVFSDRGLNGMSHIYHKLYRTRLARGHWRDRERPILINNWEATYFDFDEEKILNLARKAKDLGIELFVLDDGWFGERNSDNCSLGDWVENQKKLPNGLSGLSEKIHALDMMFGIWVEPEMISPNSALYRAHPDWCLHVRGRQRTEERNQLILDLSRAEVQDYVIEAISRVLREGQVDYVKWDMNRNMTEYFSPALEPDRQMEAQHRYMLGLYRVLDAIVTAFPRVLFESCSGGGGRFDGGMLYYMPQTWTSDNTDAVARLSIQYGTSMVYPASAMGAHVSAVPNHQCKRTTSLQMRGDVALSGNFGFELDLTKVADGDLEIIRGMVEKVKRLRSLTRTGRFSRLISPDGNRYAAWQFVSEDGNTAMLCAFSILTVANMPPVRVKMVDLDPTACYQADDGRRYSGALLMNMGLSVFLGGDFMSRVVTFSRLP